MTIWYKNYSGCGYNHSCVGWGSWSFAYKAYEPNCFKPNDAPIANNDIFVSNQGSTLTLSVSSLLSNDTDKNGDKLTITSVQSSSNGTVTLLNGNVFFTPAPHYTGPASFTYTISDGKGGTSTATVNVTVKPVNFAPDAVNDVITNATPHVVFSENKITINPTSLLANDTDVNGDTLSITSVQCATNGTVSLINGQVVFTPNPGFSGPATFSYTVSDGKGGFDTALVCLTVPKTNVNPDAVNDAMDGNEDTPFVFLASTLLDNDTDANGDSLQVISVQGAVNGTVTMVNGEVTFTPAANFYGPASFTYTISDGKGGTDTATVHLNICAVNDAPNAVDDGVFQVIQNEAITISPSTLAANDADVDGDIFYGVSLQGATNGFVEYINNQVIFTPNLNYVGPASFTYTITDGKGGFDTATVHLNVIASTNTPPDAMDDQINGQEDTPVIIPFSTILANDKDVDGNQLNVVSVQNALNGTVAIINGQIVFTPSPNYNGPASFSYTISDGKGGFDTASININLIAVDDLSITSTTFSASEEGLAGGNLDNVGLPQDNSNTSTVTGKMVIVDDAGTASVSLLAPNATISSGGQIVQWSGDSSQTLIGTAGGVVVATLSINNQGSYVFELFKSIDHPVINAEDVLQLDVGVKVSAGTRASTSTLTINLEDDAPKAITENFEVSLINTNVMIVLDTSGSMSALAVGTNKTKLEVAKESIQTLLNAFDDAGDVRVRLVTFSSSSEIVGDQWLTKLQAFAAIDALQPGGATNYDETLANAIAAFGSIGKLDHAQNISYFISDDEPNIGNGDEFTLAGDRNFSTDVGIQSAEESEWKNFLNSNQIKSYAIGVGTTVTLDDLNPIAYDGQTQQDSTAVLVNDINQLGNLLLETTPSIVNQSLKESIGADGGYVQSLIIEGVRYLFNSSEQLISVEGGPNASTFDTQTGLYTFTLLSGSRLEFDLARSLYDYKAPDGSGINEFSERFDYVLIDNDGDSSLSTVNIQVNQSVVIVNEETGGVLSGGAGFDTLYGSESQDVIIGLAGNDKLFGRVGDDVLQGGAGNDSLFGGAGADTFYWTLADKSANSSLEVDIIRDFNPNADKLDLRDLLIGESNAGGIGNLLNYVSVEQSGANTIVHVSENGGFTNGYIVKNESLQITLNDVNLLQIYADEQTAIQSILKQSN